MFLNAHFNFLGKTSAFYFWFLFLGSNFWMFFSFFGITQRAMTFQKIHLFLFPLNLGEALKEHLVPLGSPMFFFFQIVFFLGKQIHPLAMIRIPIY